jgi:hypothetical protein
MSGSALKSKSNSFRYGGLTPGGSVDLEEFTRERVTKIEALDFPSSELSVIYAALESGMKRDSWDRHAGAPVRAASNEEAGGYLKVRWTVLAEAPATANPRTASPLPASA